MPQIRLLDQATINKIAAGEVVERPASIVKELAENAVDAGATQITVEIKEGGIGYIRITDNGCGIEAEQIRTAFLRHSTSKIRKVEDLLESLTLGFRGEALASIAAVARVEMLTKPANALTGIRYVIEGGVEKVWEEVACPTGTTMLVENLFFNTPARKKFLKKPTAEGAAITDLMQKMALGHPEISFRYLNGKKEPTLFTPGKNDLKNCIYAVYGRELLDKMLPLQGEIALGEEGDPAAADKTIRVRGFISRPQMTRANRTYQNFFINGRYIRSALLEKALDEAYKDFIVPGQFPAVVLHLDMDPDALDVNVHPTKMEVRFMQEDATRRALYEVVLDCLRGTNLISRVGSFYKEEKSVAAAKTESPAAIKMAQSVMPKAAQSTVPQSASTKMGFDFYKPASKPSSWQKNEPPKRMTMSAADLAKLAEAIDKPIEMAPVTAAETVEVKKEVPRDIITDVVEVRTEKPVWPVSKPDPNIPFIIEEPDEPVSAEKADTTVCEKEEVKPPVYTGEQIKVHEEIIEPKASIVMEEEVTAYVAPPKKHNLRLVGQIFRTYWLAEEEDVFYIIDQHAAHERVLYDRYRQILRDGKMDSQILMEPAVYTVSPKAVAELDQYQSTFEKTGFEVEVFGEDAVIVRAVPYIFNGALPAEDFTKMLDMLQEGNIDTARDLLIEKIAMMSCKAAVKGNMNMSEKEARALVDQLFESENPYNCPHGRPTIISMTQYEVERKFKRV